jgi:HlyD family secretion protein
MNRWIKVLLAVGALGALAAILRFTLFAPKPIPVRAAAVERGVVEDTVTNTRAGTVKARERSRLSPQMGGLVVRLPFRKGDPVRKGDLLLKIDDAVARAQVELAKRSMDTARAQREEAAAILDLAAREWTRIARLQETGVASDGMADEARNAKQRAEAALATAEAALRQAAAAAGVAQRQLDWTELTAPFDGVVAELTTHVGEYITPAPPGVPIPPVIDLIGASELYVSAPIDEMDSSRIRLGQEARVTVDAWPDRSFRGTVHKIGAYVEDQLEQNRTVEVEVAFENPEGLRILPGTSADVEIILARRDGVLRVPTSAVSGGMGVLVVEDGRLVERTIETGLKSWTFIEVTKGLSAGETVVVSRDKPEIKPGAAVAVSEHD